MMLSSIPLTWPRAELIMRSSIPYGTKSRCGEPSHKSRGMFYPIDPGALVERGLSIWGSIEGDAIPKIAIPHVIEFFRRGDLSHRQIGDLLSFRAHQSLN